MPAVTIRKLSEETHRALKVRAAENGRSTEAEIRAILDDAVRPEKRVRMGDELAALGRRIGLRDEDMVYFERDKTPHEPISFE
jgi:plasmid stability protein